MKNRFLPAASVGTFFLAILIVCFTSVASNAQENTTKWTPEQQKELFGYCEKPLLIKQLKISEDNAEKIGQINYWATLQKIKIQENTNDTFATAKEVDEAVVKKYKSLSLSGEQLKVLVDKMAGIGSTEPCPLITLNYHPVYDSMAKPQMILLYKTRYRKQMIEKIPINGRQADQLIDAAVWKEKESLTISKLSVTDFNRIRKTVEMNNMMERKFKLMDITDQQKESAINFLNQLQ